VHPLRSISDNVVTARFYTKTAVQLDVKYRQTKAIVGVWVNSLPKKKISKKSEIEFRFDRTGWIIVRKSPRTWQYPAAECCSARSPLLPEWETNLDETKRYTRNTIEIP